MRMKNLEEDEVRRSRGPLLSFACVTCGAGSLKIRARKIALNLKIYSRLGRAVRHRIGRIVTRDWRTRGCRGRGGSR
jgi:hypothetical protein